MPNSRGRHTGSASMGGSSGSNNDGDGARNSVGSCGGGRGGRSGMKRPTSATNLAHTVGNTSSSTSSFSSGTSAMAGSSSSFIAAPATQRRRLDAMMHGIHSQPTGSGVGGTLLGVPLHTSSKTTITAAASPVTSASPQSGAGRSLSQPQRPMELFRPGSYGHAQRPVNVAGFPHPALNSGSVLPGWRAFAGGASSPLVAFNSSSFLSLPSGTYSTAVAGGVAQGMAGASNLIMDGTSAHGGPPMHLVYVQHPTMMNGRSRPAFPSSTSANTSSNANNGFASSDDSNSNSMDSFYNNIVGDFLAAPYGTVPQSIARRRLLTELKQLSDAPLDGCQASPREDNLLHWTAVIDGPSDTVYEGGTFFVELIFTDRYPFQAPMVLFLTRIYHCNINSQGKVCMDPISRSWNSCMTISTILQSLISLLYACNPKDALVPYIAEQFVKDPDEYEKMARIWTKRYAQ